MNSYSHIKRFLYILSVVFLTACIENDIPYPTIFGGFTNFEMEGQIGDAIINNDSLTITIEIGEEQDLAQVNVSEYAITEDAEVSPNPKDITDFSKPALFTISTYQDYVWTVNVSQDIAYAFVIANQVGDTDIDIENKTIKAFVSNAHGTEDIEILELKIGPDGRTTVTPDPVSVTDFTNPVEFTASYSGIVNTWTVTVEQKDCIPGADDAEIINLEFEGMISANNTITNKTGDDAYAYIDVNFPEDTDLSAVTITDFIYSDDSNYDGNWEVGSTVNLTEPIEIVLTSASCVTKRWIVRAHKALEMPNTNFSDWHESDIFNPWLNESSDYGYWSTPNVVVLGIKTQTTIPVEGGDRGEKYAYLETKKTGSPFSSFPQIAAGTIFTGRFKLAGTSVSTSPNSVSFVESLASRPLSLKFKAAYHPTNISYVDNKKVTDSNEFDKAHVWVKLMYIEGEVDYEDGINHDTPQGDKPQSLHLPQGAIILGESEMIFDGNSDWNEYSLPIDYDIESVKYSPTHIAVVATASKDGEFFTGGVGSVLEIDYFELVYKN